MPKLTEGFTPDDIGSSSKKAWHAPHCKSKAWSTPRLACISLNETRNGETTHNDEATGAADGNS